MAKTSGYDAFDGTRRNCFSRNKPRIIWGLLTTIIIVIVLISLIIFIAHKPPPKPKPPKISSFGKYKQAAIASDHIKCSELGRDILKKNGTAVDAAIATMYCSCTFHLQSCGVGGGAFMVIYQKPKNGSAKVMKEINFRETAPAASTADMFDSASSTAGGLAIAVPGFVRGTYTAWKEFGKLPWKDLLQPSINWLRNGLKVNPILAYSVELSEHRIRQLSEFSKVFLNPDGSIVKEGDTVKLPKLANTLENVANDPESFYSGDLAQDIIDDIKEANGIITKEDLSNYKAHVKDAFKQTIPGIDLTINTLAPPSSGPILAYMLKIVDMINLTPNDLNGIKNRGNIYQVIAEAMKFGFAAKTYLGDDRFVNNSKILEEISSLEMISKTVSKITLNTTHPIEYYGPANKSSIDKGTSHMSLIAPDGSAVAATSTINLGFGAGVMGKRTGILFNNEMDDFTLPNNRESYGSNNLIEPGKRPMSSMLPSIYTDNEGKVRFVVGAAGGPTILSSNFYVLTHRIWLNYTIENSIDMSRIHHQLIPNKVIYEEDFDEGLLNELKLKGHKTFEQDSHTPHSNVQVIEITGKDQKKLLTAVSDVMLDELKSKGHDFMEGYLAAHVSKINLVEVKFGGENGTEEHVIGDKLLTAICDWRKRGSPSGF